MPILKCKSRLFLIFHVQIDFSRVTARSPIIPWTLLSSSYNTSLNFPSFKLAIEVSFDCATPWKKEKETFGSNSGLPPLASRMILLLLLLRRHRGRHKSILLSTCRLSPLSPVDAPRTRLFGPTSLRSHRVTAMRRCCCCQVVGHVVHESISIFEIQLLTTHPSNARRIRHVVVDVTLCGHRTTA